MIESISENLCRIANSISPGPPIRDWGKKIHESQKLFDDFKEAMKTHDAKKILDAQFKLVELLQQIKEVYENDPSKIQEVLRGGPHIDKDKK